MDSLETLRPHQLVGKIRHVVLEELGNIDTDLNTPESRQDLLLENLAPRHTELQIGSQSLAGFMTNAVEDMWLLSRSAFNYLRENDVERERLSDEPLETISRSTGKLSFPAVLPGDSWENIKIRWIGRYNYDGLLIPEINFQVQKNEDGEETVGYSSSALCEIDSYTDVRGLSGCPAQGALLNNVFEKYIEAIFTDTLLLQELKS